MKPVILVPIAAMLAFGQSSSTVTGLVTDVTQAVAPGVKVTVTATAAEEGRGQALPESLRRGFQNKQLP